MNCREFEADVVDLARGAGMSATAAARLRAHLEHCAGCAARFARERQLTAALKAMAVAAPPSTRAAAIEQQLLAAFAARQAAASAAVPGAAGRFLATPAARAWLAAAAVLVLAVAVWQGAARWRSEPTDATPHRTPAAAPARPAGTGEGRATAAGNPGRATR